MAEPSARPSRRHILTGHPRPPFRPSPPRVTAASLAACTGCGACVDACPQHILTIAEGRVAVDFSGGACTFCAACADACREPVFAAAPVMSHAVAITNVCLARIGVACMTCRDACPEAAIRFRPRIGGPFLPEILAGACTGCGACIATCPADAIAAVPAPLATETANA
jgi:ferredoxin-type protein NapF